MRFNPIPNSYGLGGGKGHRAYLSDKEQLLLTSDIDPVTSKRIYVLRSISQDAPSVVGQTASVRGAGYTQLEAAKDLEEKLQQIVCHCNSIRNVLNDFIYDEEKEPSRWI